MTNAQQNNPNNPNNQAPDPLAAPAAPKINISGILAKKAIMVHLETCCWSARVVDKAATKELLEAKNANVGAGSVYKALINKDNGKLKRVREILGNMRRYHKANTLPWDNNGGRLLPSSKHGDYTAFFRQSTRDLGVAVQEFLAEYPDLINDATHMLGDLYESSDYTDVSDIENKFSMDVVFSPVPQGSDFRVEIPDFEQQQIAEQIEARVEGQHAQAMERVWRRIYKTVEHMNERLGKEDAVFHNTMMQNVEELVGILPQLNILGDKNLDAMTETLKANLCGYTTDELRKDKDLRKEVAEKSRDLLSKMDAMSGFSGMFGAPAQAPAPAPPIPVNTATAAAFEDTAQPEDELTDDQDQDQDTDQALETNDQAA